jgi:Flp pilus assembly protein TadG
MTVTVAIRHEKAMQLLQDLADLNLIELIPSTPDSTKRKLSTFIGKIQTGQTVD